MIKQEYLKIVRRRGMFLTAIILATVVSVGVIVTSLIIHGSNPGSYEGGRELLKEVEGLIALVSVVMAVLIGAQAGAWDFANGTFRYMVMTGRPRWKLYAMRVPALIAVVVTFVAPAITIAVIGLLVLPLDNSTAVSAEDVADSLWLLGLNLVVFTLVSFSIGALLRSSGAAIAVALVVNLIGLNLLAALDAVDETFGALMLPNLLTRLTGEDSAISVPLAALALLVWMVALLGAGALRTVESEY